MFCLKSLAAVATALVGLTGATRAAVYSNGTDLDQAVARAQPYIAINGGPAVTVEIYRSDGAIISVNSGSLLSSPDGKNRTVTSSAHAWLNALAIDPNAYARVFTGTNHFTDRGLEIRVSEVLVAPGADGTLNTLDLVAMRLPDVVPNTGLFVIGQSANNAIATTTGVGFRLTQDQLSNGTFAPRDGNHARFDGKIDLQTTVVSDYYMNAVWFGIGNVPFNGVSAGGNSGAGTFLASSFQFDAQNRIVYAEYLGTNVGWEGNRLDPFSASVYTDANNPVAHSFLMAAVAVPEPSAGGLLVFGLAAAAAALRRGPRPPGFAAQHGNEVGKGA